MSPAESRFSTFLFLFILLRLRSHEVERERDISIWKSFQMYIANSPLGRLGYNFGMVLVLLNGLSSYFLRQQEAALHFGPFFFNF